MSIDNNQELTGTIALEAKPSYNRSNDISFNSGLSLVFSKKDPFIIEFIIKSKKNYDTQGEFLRFHELYRQFSTNPGKTSIVANRL
ncbi:MAG: hypothetical protein FWG48_02935 [Oscillospiraceae bacterium]|nr:hypothetical protein [Oscillospiraceae bacterium]